MDNFYVRYHIKSGNRSISRKVNGTDINVVTSETLYAIENSDRILFKVKEGKNYCVFTESISFFEVLTEKEHENEKTLSLLSGALR